jgi:hypothetical protein
MKSYSLSYSEGIVFQYQFNQELRKFIRDNPSKADDLREWERIFFLGLTQVKNHIPKFQLVSYPRVHVFWIDPILNSSKKILQLKELLEKDPYNMGVPVLLSLCLSSDELSKFAEENGLDHLGQTLLSSEFVANYDWRADSQSFMQIDLTHFFYQQKKVVLFSPEKSIPSEFTGDYELMSY